MADEIDIEEHDLIDNPLVKTVFPDLSIVKKEIEDFDEIQELALVKTPPNTLRTYSRLQQNKVVCDNTEKSPKPSPYATKTLPIKSFSPNIVRTYSRPEKTKSNSEITMPIPLKIPKIEKLDSIDTIKELSETGASNNDDMVSHSIVTDDKNDGEPDTNSNINDAVSNKVVIDKEAEIEAKKRLLKVEDEVHKIKSVINKIVETTILTLNSTPREIKPFTGNKIILGTKKATEPNKNIVSEIEKCHNVRLVLKDIGRTLKRSETFCGICKILFQSKQSYSEHVKDTHEISKQLYDCSSVDCEETFSTVWQRDEHEHIHTFKDNTAKSKANKSDSKSEDRTDVNKATKEVEANARSQENDVDEANLCSHCKKHFPSKESLINHLYNILQPGAKKKYKCGFCPQTFTSLTLRTIHIRKHKISMFYKNLKINAPKQTTGVKIAQKLFKCHFCSYYLNLKDIEAIRSHYKNIHKDATPQHLAESKFTRKCDLCDESHASIKQHNTHVKKCHFFQCGRKISRKNAWRCRRFCPNCRCFIQYNRNRYIAFHITKQCKDTKSSLCKICGLVVTSQMAMKHKKFHNFHKGITLSDFEFYNLHDNQKILPPQPVFPFCVYCKTYYKKFKNEKHNCKEPKFFCSLCKKYYSQIAFRFHEAYHNYRPVKSESDRLYQCSQCDAMMTASNLAAHRNVKYDCRTLRDKYKKCGTCDISIVGKDFDSHKAVHERDKGFDRNSLTVIPFHKRAPGKVGLGSHVNNTSDLQAKEGKHIYYQCRKCTMCVRHQCNLLKHICMRSSQISKCTKCRLVFRTGYIKKHLSEHDQLSNFNDDNIELIPFGEENEDFNEDSANVADDTKTNSLVDKIDEEDKELDGSYRDEMSFLRTQEGKYIYYQCRKCKMCIRHQCNTMKHICMSSSRISKCTKCRLVFRIVFINKHLRQHDQLSDFNDDNIELIQFGEVNEVFNEDSDNSFADDDTKTNSLVDKIDEKDKELDSSYRDEISFLRTHEGKYIYYQCRKCKMCIRHQCNTMKHICMSSSRISKCTKCRLVFRIAFINKHLREHDQLSDFNDDNIELVQFGEVNEDFNEDSDNSFADDDTKTNSLVDKIDGKDKELDSSYIYEMSFLRTKEGKYVYYQCRNCKMCVRHQKNTLIHACNVSQRAKCPKCILIFRAANIARHLKDHEKLSLLRDDNIELIPFGK